MSLACFTTAKLGPCQTAGFWGWRLTRYDRIFVTFGCICLWCLRRALMCVRVTAEALLSVTVDWISCQGVDDFDLRAVSRLQHSENVCYPEIKCCWQCWQCCLVEAKYGRLCCCPVVCLESVMWHLSQEVTVCPAFEQEMSPSPLDSSNEETRSF